MGLIFFVLGFVVWGLVFYFLVALSFKRCYFLPRKKLPKLSPTARTILMTGPGNRPQDLQDELDKISGDIVGLKFKEREIALIEIWITTYPAEAESWKCENSLRKKRENTRRLPYSSS